jgi:hypothetical protein
MVADLVGHAAEELGDQRQLARSHDSKATAFFHLEDYSNALKHYNASYEIYMAQGNVLYAGHTLINRSDILWRLGDYPAARDSLREAQKVSEQPDGTYRQLRPSIYLIKARLELSRRDFQAAKSNAQNTLSLVLKEHQDQHTIVEAYRILGLADIFTGMKKEGRRLCENGMKMAEEAGDPELIGGAQLALAEALLESGDANGALDNALRAQTYSANSGRQEIEWRALLIAARATSQLRGEKSNEALEYLKHAENSFESLRQKWSAETLAGYLSRRDVQFYRQQLQATAAKSHKL